MKILRVIALFGAVIVLSGCASGFSRHGYKLPPGQPSAEVLNRPIVIKANMQFDTNNVDVLGSIHSYDTGFSTRCDEPYVLGVFCDDGRILGADVVNITEEEPPDILSSCYRARAQFLRFKDRAMAEGLASDPQYDLDLVKLRAEKEAGREEALTAGAIFGGLTGEAIADAATQPHGSIGQLQEAALNGDVDAQFALGLDYEYGHGVHRNYANAMKWYQPAANRGNPMAQNNLAAFYLYGWGTATNYDEAADLYKQAAEQGYPPAQCNLGYMYENGFGVSTDKVAAVTCYRAAAEQGYPDAMMNLGACYRDGNGVSRDPLIAYMWMDCASRLADQSPDDQAKSKIRNTLDALKQNMTPDQIKQGDALANQWYENFQKTHPPME